jgi:hypothetical protein
LKLKGSLALSCNEFRERFKQDAELFRTLPSSSSLPVTGGIPRSPIASHKSPSPPSTLLLLGEDLVRTERLAQCCKRVRIWRRQTTNPLLSFKHQQLARSITGVGTSSSTSLTPATDHRMHLSLLMTMIVDIYEQKMAFEVGAAAVLLPVGGLAESFPEFVVKWLSTRASTRRAALEQVHAMVAILLQPSTHARVRAFASLCGVDDSYNPPEKVRAFLHMIESIHRLKVSATMASSLSAGIGSAGGSAVAVRPEDASSLGEVVFYNLGVTLAVAHKVIAELFDEEYNWNFRFWHSHFQELKVHYAWPPSAKLELEEKAVHLTTVTRSAVLNTAKKIDTDAFLELLLDTWTQRAKQLCDMLEGATNDEERKGAQALAHKQAVQDARGHIAPLCDAERRVFDELVDEFWNAEVPWATDVKIQRRMHAAASETTRSVDEMASLYRKHMTELEDDKKVWAWSQWAWDPEWEWGLLEIRGADEGRLEAPLVPRELES